MAGGAALFAGFALFESASPVSQATAKADTSSDTSSRPAVDIVDRSPRVLARTSSRDLGLDVRLADLGLAGGFEQAERWQVPDVAQRAGDRGSGIGDRES